MGKLNVSQRHVKSIAKAGSAKIKGDVTLTGGSNITLTQSSNDISIASTATGGGSGEDVSSDITQTAHGFAITNAIYHNGTTWIKAKADAAATLGTHIVTVVTDANTFTATLAGRKTVTSHGLTVGEFYFVSDSTAGGLTVTEPHEFSNPLVFVESSSILQILPYRASDAGEAGTNTMSAATFCDATGGQTVSTSTTTLNIDTTLLNTDASNYSLSADEITIAESGNYFVSVESTARLATGVRSGYTISLQQDSGSGFAFVDGSLGYCYGREITETHGTANTTSIISVSAGDKIKIVGSGTTQSFTTIADGSRITIFKLEVPSSGGVDQDGWVDAGETWLFNASNGSYDQGLFTISGDKTNKYSVGMKISFDQPTDGLKHAIITKVAYSSPNTTVTMYLGTEYDFDAESMNSPKYSTARSPLGFPMEKEKWTMSFTDTSNRAQSSPTVNVWYNVGTSTIPMPIGSWTVSTSGIYYGIRPTAATVSIQTTLSTTNSSSGIASSNSWAYVNDVTELVSDFNRSFQLTLTANGFYYLNMRTTNSSMTSINFRGADSTTTISAVCNYL